ncbi:hypothetical protein [Mycolicibacterium sp.]|uniref:hypothetical protein n=1 Tax=Mycolicibacterium sp. TaxID=2320850 RepID=UPI00355FDCA8
MDLDAYPDFDLTFLDGSTGDDLTALSEGLETAAAGLNSATDDLTHAVEGETASAVHGEITAIRQTLESRSTEAASAAAAFTAMRAAWRDWQRDAPRQAELRAAAEAVKAAQNALADAADGSSTTTARQNLKDAEAELRVLLARRKDADEALAAGLEKAGTKLSGRDGKREDRGGSFDRAPGADKVENPADSPAGKSAPGSPAPAAAGRPSGTPAPAAAAAPATSLSSATPSQAEAVNALLAQQKAQQGQPAAVPPQQAPAPVAAPMAAGGAPAPGGPTAQPRNDKSSNGAVDSKLLDDMLGVGAPTALAAMAATVPATVTAPSPAPAAPAPVPSGPTGTSTPGLATDSNVTGRADAPRGAFSPPTNLSAGGTEQATGTARPGGETAARPMGGGVPMAPMMGGMGSGGGGAPKKDGEEQIRVYSPETAELHGEQTRAESVRGGTIAQRRDGGAA